MGKIIVIEGTDCSGKETQQKLIAKRLKDKYIVEELSFPNYNTPTGIIIGSSYLGKPHLTDIYLKENKGLFDEGASSVDPYVSSLYYAADRRYSLPIIKEKMNKSDILFLDRYVFSNMAHQAGRLINKEERLKMYEDLETFEFGILNLPKPDLVILLYVPYEYSYELKVNRSEALDELESDKEHLILAENAYLEIAKRNNFVVINCIKEEKMRTIEDINEEIYEKVREFLNDK